MKTDSLFYRLFQIRPPWRVVVIYSSRSVEKEAFFQFGDLLALNRVTCIYLDELPETASSPLGIQLVKLIIAEGREIAERARKLWQQAAEAIEDSQLQKDIIDLIESIVVYKFPKRTRQEIAAMFGVEDLKQTRFYQEVFAEGKQEGKQEGKLEAVSRMVEAGIDLETIAQCLDLPLDVVREEANQKQ
jgi:predicted transposase/invertase (TIGR01784 family)